MSKKKKQESTSDRKSEHKRPSKNWSSFDEFWLSVSSEKKIPKALKGSILKHLEATGTNRPERFEEGLRSFGIK